MRYSYNSTNHCHVSVSSDSRLELRITRGKAQAKDTSKLRSTSPSLPAKSTPRNYQAVGMSLSRKTLTGTAVVARSPNLDKSAMVTCQGTRISGVNES